MVSADVTTVIEVYRVFNCVVERLGDVRYGDADIHHGRRIMIGCHPIYARDHS